MVSDQYPTEVMVGVANGAIRTLRTDDLEGYIGAPSNKSVELNVVEVTLADGSEERRAFVDFSNDGQAYVGPLQMLSPDIPLEFIFLELGDTRFIAMWILEAASESPTFVTIGRPEQLANDDSMRVLSSGGVVNRVGLILIPANQLSLWQGLTTIRVNGEDVLNRYAWEEDFDPPLSIESKFIKVNLP